MGYGETSDFLGQTHFPPDAVREYAMTPGRILGVLLPLHIRCDDYTSSCRVDKIGNKVRRVALIGFQVCGWTHSAGLMTPHKAYLLDGVVNDNG